MVLVLDRCREVLVLVDLDKVVFNRHKDRVKEVHRQDRKVRVIMDLRIDLVVVVLVRQQQQGVLVPLELVLVGLSRMCSFIIHIISREDLKDIILDTCRIQMMGFFGTKGSSRIGDRGGFWPFCRHKNPAYSFCFGHMFVTARAC